MELSSSVTKKWEEKFLVKEIWFEPDTGGFFSKPATIYVIGIPCEGDKDKNAVTLEVPFSKSRVSYKSGDSSTLLIELQIKKGQRMDAYMSGPYTTQELVSAHFALAPKNQILIPKRR